jgi:hypothetical protein
VKGDAEALSSLLCFVWEKDAIEARFDRRRGERFEKKRVGQRVCVSSFVTETQRREPLPMW